MNLLELAARCEAATGPDRELDAAIVAEIRRGWRHPDFINPPPYTASIDAAMTLVPEGVYAMATKRTNGKGLAEVGKDGGWRETAWGETPAIALCAAALKARALAGIETGTAETVKQGSVPKG